MAVMCDTRTAGIAAAAAYDPVMRAIHVLGLFTAAAAAAAACGGGGDDGGVDGPPAGATLPERLTVTTSTIAQGVHPGESSWRIWGTASLKVAPVFTAPTADCGELIGFTTGTGGAPRATVVKLDATDHVTATFDLGACTLRGLAAEPAGHFGALLWDQAVSPASLHVTRFDAGGTAGWTASLDDALAMPTDFGIGDSRLAFGQGRYGAYYHVHGISGFANGHEGDQLKWVDAGTGAVSNGWSWGCSHSMSALLGFQPTDNKFMAACVTDCYPGTSGDFATNAIGGVYLDNRTKVLDVDGGCNGSVAGELGSAAQAPSGWKLVWNSHQAAATHGQGSYQPSTMNQDIGFASIAGDLTPGAVTWITTTIANESDPSIARWQPDGDDSEQYVLGWAEPTGPAPTHKLAVVDAAGAMKGQAFDVGSVARWGERDDPFRVAANHDIVWAWFDAAGDTTLNVARIRSGRACTP